MKCRRRRGIEPRPHPREGASAQLLSEAVLTMSRCTSSFSRRLFHRESTTCRPRRGMDVVKSNVTRCGTVEIHSKQGVGSRCVCAFRSRRDHRRLPNRVGNSSFVIPLDLVEECVELNPANAESTRLRQHTCTDRTAAHPLRTCSTCGRPGDAKACRGEMRHKQASRIVVDELLGELQASSSRYRGCSDSSRRRSSTFWAAARSR